MERRVPLFLQFLLLFANIVVTVRCPFLHCPRHMMFLRWSAPELPISPVRYRIVIIFRMEKFRAICYSLTLLIIFRLGMFLAFFYSLTLLLVLLLLPTQHFLIYVP